MPIDFEREIVYPIDYEQLFDTLRNLPIFESSNIQEKYFYTWRSILENQDKHDSDNRHTLLANAYHSDYFQYEFHFNDNHLQVFCHFDLSRLAKILDDQKIDHSTISVSVPLKEITEENSDYQYYFRDIDVTRSFNKTPIYFCPIYTLDRRLLLIDGNHRLEHARRIKLKEIDCIFFSDQFFIENCLFLSAFDYLFYVFFRELAFFIQSTAQQQSDEMLLASSFLSQI
ncbi:hypothetical protein HCC60_07730 [Streptococcus suis]|nr:hypothetical protein [Streptococcus suis]